MDTREQHRKPRWWRLSRLECWGCLVGAVTGLIAAAPLLWLAAEAHRIGHAELIRAARFQPWELVGLWFGGMLVGSLLAVHLARGLLRVQGLQPVHWPQHLLHLFLGAVIIMVVAAVPAALLLGLLQGPRSFLDLYLIGGGLVGWQSGVIAYVFLYTFNMLDQVRRHKEQPA